MSLITEANQIVKRLVKMTPLAEWSITCHRHNLEPDSDDELYVASKTFLDEDLKRAKIWIDPRFPRDEELYTLEELIAHELGHLILGVKPDEERSATRVGMLLLAKVQKPTMYP